MAVVTDAAWGVGDGLQARRRMLGQGVAAFASHQALLRHAAKAGLEREAFPQAGPVSAAMC